MLVQTCPCLSGTYYISSTQRVIAIVAKFKAKYLKAVLYFSKCLIIHFRGYFQSLKTLNARPRQFDHITIDNECNEFIIY